MNAEFQAVRDAAEWFVATYDALMRAKAVPTTDKTACQMWDTIYLAEQQADATYQRLKRTIDTTKHYADEKPARNARDF